MDYGLTGQELKDILEKIKMNPRMQGAILFGSRAKGNHKLGSDIDIALVGDHLRLNDLLDLASDMEDLMLPFKFDLVIYRHIKEPALLDHIDRVGITLWQKMKTKSE